MRAAGTLPGALAGLDRLTSLVLSSNWLNGTLPAAFAAGFPALAELHLDYNAFTGSLPAAWLATRGGLPALQSLALEGNLLAGALPDAAPGALASLLSLGLQWNQLEARAPLPPQPAPVLHGKGGGRGRWQAGRGGLRRERRESVGPHARARQARPSGSPPARLAPARRLVRVRPAAPPGSRYEHAWAAARPRAPAAGARACAGGARVRWRSWRFSRGACGNWVRAAALRRCRGASGAGHRAGQLGAAARAQVRVAAARELPAVRRAAAARALRAVQGAARRVRAAEQPGAGLRPGRAHGAADAAAHGDRHHAAGARPTPPASRARPTARLACARARAPSKARVALR